MSEMDKILRNKLYEHGSAMPTDMWDRIESGLEKKKKRRGLWILLPLGFLGLGLWSMFYFSQAPSFSSDLAISSSESASEVELVPHENADKGLAKRNSLPLASEDLENESVSKRPPSFPSEENVLPPLTSIAPEVHSAALARTSPLEIYGAEEDESVDLRERFNVVEILKLPQGNIDLKEKSFPDPIGCPTFSDKLRPNLLIEAYYKPFYGYKRLGSNSDEIGDTYLGLREDSEQSLYSWAAGAYVGWISQFNVGVKAGAEYEVINERFSYIDPNAIRNQTVITIDTVFNTDGSFMVNTDTSVVEVPGTEVQEIANYHRTLSIPIHALYHVDAGNFAFEFSGGPIFNLTYQNRGKIVDPSNEDQWFTKGRSGAYDVFKNKLSVSFSLSASIMYSLNENIQVYARPEFKFHPTSIAKNSSPFTQQYLNSGIALGVRYYFSGNPNF